MATTTYTCNSYGISCSSHKILECVNFNANYSPNVLAMHPKNAYSTAANKKGKKQVILTECELYSTVGQPMEQFYTGEYVTADKVDRLQDLIELEFQRRDLSIKEIGYIHRPIINTVVEARVLNGTSHSINEVISILRTFASAKVSSNDIIYANLIQPVVNLLNALVKECICYTDCGGYSVCHCYSHCNNY